MKLKTSVFLLAVLLATAGFAFMAADPAAAAGTADEQCLKCHANPNLNPVASENHRSLQVDPGVLEDSVHGFADCTSCHSEGVDVYPHEKVVYGHELEQQVMENACGQCHTQVMEEYLQGPHGQFGTPNCLDCHGSGHQIQPVTSELSPLEGKAGVETCSSCHKGTVLESYAESFHGKAVNLGSTKAATCADCHGGHAVFGPDNPASPVAAQNVAQTCASCHGNAAQGFAQGVEHFELKPEGNGLPMYYTLKFFTWLTIVVMVLLILHIILELFHRLKSSREGGNY